MTDEELAYLSELTFFHGTTRKTWGERGEGMDGGLYLTANPNDALNYADEAAIGEHCDNDGAGSVQAAVVTVSGARLVELLAANSKRHALVLEPDWGWVNGLRHDAGHNGGTAPQADWRSSFEACRCVHVAGFAHEDKADLVLADYTDFEALHAQAPPATGLRR